GTGPRPSGREEIRSYQSGRFSEGHGYLLLAAVPGERQSELIARLARLHGCHQVAGAGDVLRADLDDHVALLDAGLGGRAAGRDRRDERAAAVAVAHLHSEERVADLAALEELVGRGLGLVARDREAHADVAALALAL